MLDKANEKRNNRPVLRETGDGHRYFDSHGFDEPSAQAESSARP
jgi:hypothetical protein